MTTKTSRAFSDMAIPPAKYCGGARSSRNDPERIRGKARLACTGDKRDYQGKKALTPDTAIALEKVLGIDAQFWDQS